MKIGTLIERHNELVKKHNELDPAFSKERRALLDDIKWLRQEMEKMKEE